MDHEFPIKAKTIIISKKENKPRIKILIEAKPFTISLFFTTKLIFTMSSRSLSLSLALRDHELVQDVA